MLLSVFCIVITLVLYALRIPASVFIGIVITAAMGLLLNLMYLPTSIIDYPKLPEIGHFIQGFDVGLLTPMLPTVLFCLVIMNFFEGTACILSARMSMGDAADEESFNKALKADSVSSTAYTVFGVPPSVPFIESLIGIKAGARTGLMPLLIIPFLILTLFLGSLFQSFGYPCTVGAMFLIGASTVYDLRRLEKDDIPILVSSVLMIVSMIWTYSICDGLAIGTIAYCALMVAMGRWREVRPAMYIVTVVVAAYLFMIGTIG